MKCPEFKIDDYLHDTVDQESPHMKSDIKIIDF